MHKRNGNDKKVSSKHSTEDHAGPEKYKAHRKRIQTKSEVFLQLMYDYY